MTTDDPWMHEGRSAAGVHITDPRVEMMAHVGCAISDQIIDEVEKRTQ